MPNRRTFTALLCLVPLIAPPAAWSELRIDLVGQWGGSANAVDMHGSYAFVGIGPRLVVLDLSDPAHPRRSGQTLPLGHIPTAIEYDQGRCYVGLITGLLQIVDVGDPTRPVSIGSCQLGARVIDIAAQDGLAVVSTEAAGIYVVDVSAPAEPVILYNLNNPYYGSGSVSLRGHYAYCIEDGLRVLDLSDPAHPQTLGVNPDVSGQLELTYIPEFDELWGITIGESGIEGIWLNDPWLPAPPMWIGNYSGGAREIALEGDAIYIGDGRIYEAESPLHYLQRGVGPPRRTNWSLDLAVQDGIVCTTDGYFGLQIVDARDAAHPELLTYYDDSNHSLHVSAANGLAFVSGYRAGLQILEVSDPAEARRIAEWDLPFSFRVRTQAALAVIAEAEALRTVDMTDLHNPRTLGLLPLEQHPVDLVLDGALAYIANNSAGLTIVDVSDPAAPRVIANLDTGTALGITKRDHIVYLAMYDQGLHIIDVSEPTAPLLLGSVVTPGLAYAVAAVDGAAYVASLGGVCVVDCSDLSAPRFVSRLPGDSQWQTIEAAGDRVYVGAHAGLLVLDIADRLDPRIIGRSAGQGWIQGLHCADGLVYMATDAGGMEILAPRASGDLDGDGSVGLFDLSALLSSFGACADETSFNRYADLDGDACVSIQDLAALLAAFGG